MGDYRFGCFFGRHRFCTFFMGGISVFEHAIRCRDRIATDGYAFTHYCWCIDMAGEQTKPLTIEEAKRHLRYVAQEAGLSAWVKRKPLRAIALGFVAGVMLGSSPRTRDLVVQNVSRQLLKSLF